MNGSNIFKYLENRILNYLDAFRSFRCFINENKNWVVNSKYKFKIDVIILLFDWSSNSTSENFNVFFPYTGFSTNASSNWRLRIEIFAIEFDLLSSLLLLHYFNYYCKLCCRNYCESTIVNSLVPIIVITWL